MYKALIIAAIGLLMNSCYTRELYYSLEPSSGGVVVGSTYYYLAQVKEFKKPAGISRVPDGGMAKETRQVFGLFGTDSLENRTFLASRMSDICCWPSRYKTRLDKTDLFIAIGIVNINFPDSLDGIYLYNLSSKTLKKYISAKTLPAITENSNNVAYCVDYKLSIEDYTDGTQLFSYILNEKPVYVDWKNNDEIFIYQSDPFSVQVLKLSSGKTTLTNLKYLPNYAQDKNKTQLLKVIKKSNPDLKGLLEQ